MRLYPPAWAIGRRNKETYQLKDYEIPPGTIFLMSQYLMHRDQRFYEAPLSFNPDRWTGVHGLNLHDLLPFPYTQEALDHVCARVHHVQERLGRQICLENVSTYVEFNSSEMTEWEFIAELTRRTGCWLLFDVNNVYVSSFNHGYDAKTFLDGIPADRVVQFHLAGHSEMGTHIIDTHDHPVTPEVFDLYAAALKRFGPVSTMIERDDNIPPIAELVDELNEARKIAERVLGQNGARGRSKSKSLAKA